jgi:hypothetical protein
MQTAGQAAALATEYIAEIERHASSFIKAFPQAVPAFINAHIGAAMGKGNKIDKNIVRFMSLLSREQQANVQFAGQDCATAALWETHKVVYHFDPDLTRELGETEDDAVIPAGLFQKLPHPDPFIAFPEPMWMMADTGLVQRVDGFFVTGRIRGEQGAMQRSTHYPGVDEMGILLCGPLFHEGEMKPYLLSDGKQDVLLTRVLLPCEETTVKVMIDSVGIRFLNLSDSTYWRENVPHMIKRAVSMLIYICATNADLKPLPKPPARAKGGTRDKKRKPVQVVGVGYRIGPALKAYRKREATTGQGTGRTVRAHIRRAHLHTFKVGPGRTQSMVKWLPPIPVNADGTPAEQPTVIGVPK